MSEDNWHALGSGLFFASIVTWSYFVNWYWSDEAIEARLDKWREEDKNKNE